MYKQAQNPRFVSLMGLFLAALLLGGCTSTATPTEPPEPAEVEAPATPPAEPIREPEPEPPSDFARDGVTPIDSSGRPISRTFYFDFDKSVIKPAAFAALELHAQILRRNSDRSIVIEGHCDERGTREYNLALGERRADAVRSFLISAGVSSRQIETVSYGEERPEDPGHNESAWERNRRAIVNYR